MFSESCSSSFLFMGVSSNSKVFLSDKDLKGVTTTTTTNNNNNNVDPELGLLVHKEGRRPLFQEDHHLIKLKELSVQERDQQEGDHHQEEQKQQRHNIIVTKPVCLKLEIPSSYVGPENYDEDDCCNDGFKTPTCSDNKIPMIQECPGAPKRTRPRAATKRKACRRRMVLDVSKDLESLFPAMPYVVDLGGGGMNKRVKQ